MLEAPIIYAQAMMVRFDDLDPYGHVNASRYIDFVGSSRLLFASTRLGLSIETLAARDVGWFLRHADCSYHRPISGIGDILVRSWLTRMPSDCQFPVDFEILDPRTGAKFSSGRMTYVTMSLNQKKPMDLPDWLAPYLFEPSLNGGELNAK